MPNRALRSRVVELEKDTCMSGEHEENLASRQKKSVEEIPVVMNLGQDEVRIGHSKKESVNTELEKNTSEINVTQQASVEAPSINTVTMPNTLRAMFNSMLASNKF
jgi:hypothetical protein